MSYFPLCTCNPREGLHSPGCPLYNIDNAPDEEVTALKAELATLRAELEKANANISKLFDAHSIEVARADKAEAKFAAAVKVAKDFLDAEHDFSTNLHRAKFHSNKGLEEATARAERYKDTKKTLKKYLDALAPQQNGEKGT